MLNLQTLFNKNFYLSQYPDVAQKIANGSFKNAFEHFNEVGKYEGRNPSALFDNAYYLATNPGVEAAVAKKEITAIDHFILFGQFEDRNPSSLFDTAYYLDKNPGVASAVAKDQLTGIEHFINYGQQEGRNPSPLFNPRTYLARNPDITGVLEKDQLTGIEHYIKFGAAEKRKFTAIPLLVDDDGSQDGMSAIAFMLQNPKFDLKAIAISQGLAHPQVFGNNVTRMLTRLGKTNIPVGVGRETPLAGNNAFPDAFRVSSDNFWKPYVTLPDRAQTTVDRRDAVQLIIDTVKQSPEPIDILATGPLTNLAEALRRDPTIKNNIAAVEIMGGAIFVPGNLREHLDPILKQNAVAEFNIWSDPVAAKEVFSSGLPLYLTPLDATNKIGFTDADREAWKASGTPEGILAAELLDFALTEISGNDPLIPNPAWDLVAAINLSEEKFSQKTPLHIDIITDTPPSTTQGQTVAINNLPPNVKVSLNPSFSNLSFSSRELFSGK